MNPIFSRHHYTMMVALFCLLCAIYMLIYSGRHSFNDELQMYNTTASMVDFSDDKYDFAMWYVWDNYGQMGRNTDELYPLITSPIEPVFSFAGTPLYALARHFSLGLLHTTYLLNVFVGATLCIAFFIYARLLGYPALLATLALGICTIVLPYTKTYMRELLAMLWLLFSAIAIELAHRRQSGARALAYLGAGTMFVLAFFTKESSLMLLPMLIFFALPKHLSFFDKKQFLRLGDALFVLSIMIIALLIYTPLPQWLLPERITLVSNSLFLTSSYTSISLHNYLLSPNVSLWGTSPVLLLSLVGAYCLIHTCRRRLLWGVWMGVLGITLGHAFTTGEFWFAGATLPPRFIMLVIPFVMLLTLPVFEYLMQHKRHWLIVPVVVLIVISLYAQFIHSALDWRLYPLLLPPESNALTTWLPSHNLLKYSRPILMTPSLFNTQLDSAWLRTGQLFPGMIFTVLIGLYGWMLWRGIYQKRGVVFVLPFLLMMAIGIGLLSIRHDPLHFGDRQALHAVGTILEEQEVVGDVLLLNDPHYVPFFLNYRPFDHVRVVSVQSSPGERASFEHVPQVVSEDIRDLLAPRATNLIKALMIQRPRLWVLMDTSPFLAWSIRPIERYLSQYYYLIQEIPTGVDDAYVRLLEYATIPAPDPRAEANPQVSTMLVFDEALALVGFTIPNNKLTYHQNDILAVTLYWQAQEAISSDYRVALFLADDTGYIHAQGFDTAPQAGFMPTYQMMDGQFVADNRAMRIPSTLPIGEYRLLVRVYTFGDAGLVLGVLADGSDITALPVTIHIGDS